MGRSTSCRASFTILTVLFYIVTDVWAKHACGPGGVCTCDGLEYVDCSGRNLTKVPESIPSNTLILFLDGNNLKKLPIRIFATLEILDELFLSRNRIVDLPETIFLPLNNLTYLSLKSNYLQRLHSRLFANLENLMGLSLQNNRISELTKYVFSSLKKLERLELSNNRLVELPDDLVLNMDTCDILNFSSNNLTKLPENGFGKVTSVKTIQFQNNSLQTITKDNFGNITDVVALYLPYNQIPYLPGDLFSNLRISRILDLSNNRLTSLPENVFNTNSKTHHLEILFLQRNLIVFVPRNAFRGLLNLRSVCLFYNKIQVLGDDAFSGTSVENIYLFGNSLSVLVNASFNNNRIKEIHLYGNAISQINDTSLKGIKNTTKVFVDCQNVERLIRINVALQCVTPQFVPKLTVDIIVSDRMVHEGFQCKPKVRLITSECSPCGRGTISIKGECIGCPRGGFYEDEIGVVSSSTNGVCKRCRDGTYVPDGRGTSPADCTLCPDGTKTHRHAGHRACFCLDNYSRTDRFGACVVCLEKGVNCNGKDYKSIQNGFYWSWNLPGANLTSYNKFVENLNTENSSFDSYTNYTGEIPRAFRCPRRESCNNTKDNVEAICAKGYKGWLCSKCKIKFYSVMNYCLPCPEKKWLYIELALIVCFFLMICALIVYFYKQEKGCKTHGRSIINIFMSRGKIVLGFYQVVGEIFTSLHDVNWAPTLKLIGNLISLIQLNVLQLFIRPKCFDEKWDINPKMKFMIALSFPLLLIALSFAVYRVLIVRHKLRIRFNHCSHFSNTYVKSLKSKFFTFCIVAIFVTYPATCNVIFQFYPRACEAFCLDIQNTTCDVLLRSDYDIKCNTLKVYNMFAYFATVVYVVAYPTLLLFLMRRKSKSCSLQDTEGGALFMTNGETSFPQKINDASLCNQVSSIWIDFLCENYRPQYWYWEIVELARKVTQTVLITLLGWENRLTVLVTIGTSVLFLTLHALCMPMKNAFEQRLQMFSLVAILSNVLVAAMDFPEAYGSAMSIVLIVLNVLVIAIIIGKVILEVLLRLRKVKFHINIIRYGAPVKTMITNVFKKRSR